MAETLPQTPTGFLETVSDDFRLRHFRLCSVVLVIKNEHE